MARHRWLDRAGFVGTSVGVLVSGVVHGLQLLSLRIELLFVVAIITLLHAMLSALLAAAFILVSGLVFFARALHDRHTASHTPDGGTVVAVVPVYDDAAVLDRSVESLLASSYRNLAIRIVCEPDDTASLQRARSFAAHEKVEVLVNRERPQSKAGAINTAAEATDSRYLAVFDADERVHPAFIGHAVSELEEAAIVQGRTIPEPTGVIEALAYYESVLLSYVGRRLLYLVTDFRTASSRAIVMERAAFEQVDGYDGEMLTEDFEFTYRCYMAGVDVTETLAYPSRITAAHTIRDWWGQRKRWMTGYVQVLHRLLASIDPRSYRSLVSPLICAGTLIGSALLVSLLSRFVVLVLVSAETWLLLPVGSICVVALGVRLTDAWQTELPLPRWHWALAPTLLPVYGFATLKAVFEYLVSWEGEWYSVDKTG